MSVINSMGAGYVLRPFVPTSIVNGNDKTPFHKIRSQTARRPKQRLRHMARKQSLRHMTTKTEAASHDNENRGYIT